jgi:putative ABC transport system permease protein
VLILAGLSVADVLYVNIKERAPELVTLRTTGWSAGDLAKLVLSEAAGIGLLGGLTGAGLAVVISLVLVRGIAVTTVLTWSVVGLAVGFFVALLASVVPAARISAQTPPSVLAEE